MPPAGAFGRLAIEAEDLACARGGFLVFSNVSFRVRFGQLLTVTGPNGSGKSSLLRLLAGLLRPQAGRLWFEGGGDEDAIAHYVGHADALKPALRLRETLRFWATIYGADDLGEAQFRDTAAAVGLDHALDLPVRVLSAGQRRRIALARLLISPRPLWLLDEPAAALDRLGEALLERMMRAHLAAGGLIVAATHADLPVPSDAVLDLGRSA